MIRRFFFCILLINATDASAQFNFYEKGDKALYWGISISANSTNYSIERQPISPANDTFISVFTRNSPGFNLGLIGNWQFNRFFDLRFVPSMAFSEKNIVFQTQSGYETQNKATTTYLTFPLLLRFKTEPINDLRVFVLGGGRLDVLINPQFRPLNDPDKMTYQKNNFIWEYGFGIQYFFEYFIFSPEIKFFHGINSVWGSDQSERNHAIIKSVFPRGFVISLNFEG